MPSFTTDTNHAWRSNRADQAPYTNGIVANGVNETHTLNGSDGARVAHGENEANLMNEKHHQISRAELDDVPVLIVGGGPTGLLMAYLLSKLNGMSKHLISSILLHLTFASSKVPADREICPTTCCAESARTEPSDA